MALFVVKSDSIALILLAILSISCASLHPPNRISKGSSAATRPKQSILSSSSSRLFSRRPSSTSATSCVDRTVKTSSSRVHASHADPLRAHLCDKTFFLNEIVEDQQFLSMVILASSGDVIFSSTELPNVKHMRGSWSIDHDALKMVIDRTYTGSRTEYNSRSHYLGFTDVNGFHVIVGEEVCDNKMCQELDDGKFILTMVGDSSKSTTKSTRSKRKTEADMLLQ